MVSEEFIRSDTYKQIATAVNRITNSLDADRSTLFLVDRERGQLVAEVAEGVEEVEIRVQLGEGIAGQCAKFGKEIRHDDAYSHEGFKNNCDQETGYESKSVIDGPGFRKVHDNNVIGVIEVLNKHTGRFTKDDEDILKMFSNVIGMVIESKIQLEGIVPEG